MHHYGIPQAAHASGHGVSASCRDFWESEDAPQPEHEPVDEANAEDKVEEEDVLVAATGRVNFADAEQPEVEPATENGEQSEQVQIKVKGVEYFEIGSDIDKESSTSSYLDITPRGNLGNTGARSHLQPPSPITEHFMIGSDAEDEEAKVERSGCEADVEDDDPRESESEQGEAGEASSSWLGALAAIDVEAAWRREDLSGPSESVQTDQTEQTDQTDQTDTAEAQRVNLGPLVS